MESFINKNEMIKELKKRNIAVEGIFLYGQNPTEYAGEWKYKYPPPPGKEEITPVEADLTRKYQKTD